MQVSEYAPACLQMLWCSCTTKYVVVKNCKKVVNITTYIGSFIDVVIVSLYNNDYSCTYNQQKNVNM